MGRIPISGPSISEKEIAYVTDAVTRCWYGNANLYHEKFQKAFASYLGVRYAVPLPSCTAALHLALAALGVGPGDEVIVPECTWIASSAPISYVGAVPVFADVDPVTWCLTPASLERGISPRTKAVIAVDLYGNVPDYDALLEVCSRRSIPVHRGCCRGYRAVRSITGRRAEFPWGPSERSAFMAHKDIDHWRRRNVGHERRDDLPSRFDPPGSRAQAG